MNQPIRPPEQWSDAVKSPYQQSEDYKLSMCIAIRLFDNISLIKDLNCDVEIEVGKQMFFGKNKDGYFLMAKLHQERTEAFRMYYVQHTSDIVEFANYLKDQSVKHIVRNFYPEFR